MGANEWIANAQSLQGEVESLAHTADFLDDTDGQILELLADKIDTSFKRAIAIAQDYAHGNGPPPTSGGPVAPSPAPATPPPPPAPPGPPAPGSSAARRQRPQR